MFFKMKHIIQTFVLTSLLEVELNQKTWVGQKFCNICVRTNFRNKFQELKEIEQMPHPAYSQNQSHSDYHLFQSTYVP